MNHTSIYNQIVERAKSRGLDKSKLSGYFECHHITPRCLGGIDSKDNLVLLTAREHFICHALLCYVYPENTKLLYAFNMMKMTSKSHNRYISALDYKLLKEQLSRVISEQNSGYKHKDETLLLMSNLKLGNKLPQHHIDSIVKSSHRGNDSHLFKNKLRLGTTHTYETKQKMSIKSKGRKQSDNQKLMISIRTTGINNPNYGNHSKLTLEHRSKISTSVTGKNNPFYNKTHNDTSKSLMVRNRVMSVYKRVLVDITNNNEPINEQTYNKYKRPRDPSFDTCIKYVGVGNGT